MTRRREHLEYCSWARKLTSFSPIATKVSKAIQAAECSHNTRVSGQQTFAVFETDHQYDSSHGAPYGTCSAYTCESPTSADMKADEDCWTFFWTYVDTLPGRGRHRATPGPLSFPSRGT